MAWEATAGNGRRRRAAALDFGGLLLVRFAAGAAEAVGEKPLEPPVKCYVRTSSFALPRKLELIKDLRTMSFLHGCRVTQPQPLINLIRSLILIASRMVALSI